MSQKVADAEILACCRKLLQTYGPAARGEARCRRDRLLADDDFEGYLIWARIESTIGNLSGQGLPADTYN